MSESTCPRSPDGRHKWAACPKPQCVGPRCKFCHQEAPLADPVRELARAERGLERLWSNAVAKIRRDDPESEAVLRTDRDTLLGALELLRRLTVVTSQAPQGVGSPLAGTATGPSVESGGGPLPPTPPPAAPTTEGVR